MKFFALLLYLSIGLGVASHEAENRPEIMADHQLMVLSIALWPAFPAKRLYTQAFGS